MANKMNMAQAVKRLRSGRVALAQPSIVLAIAGQDSSRDTAVKPEVWQGQGKRKKPQRS